MAESWSLIFRYAFVVLGGLILLLVILWCLRDARRYRRTIKNLPDAGRIGELRCDTNGKRYPLPREGYIGRSLSCDIRVRGAGIQKRHVEFIYRPGKGLLMRPVGNQSITVGEKKIRGTAYAQHGTQVRIGELPFTVLFFEGLDEVDPRDYGPDPAWQEEESKPVWNSQPAVPDPWENDVPPDWGRGGSQPVPGNGYAPVRGMNAQRPMQNGEDIPEDWGQSPDTEPSQNVYPYRRQGDQ